jgi:acyl-CoA synthetase (AMP-forming)/AMP-acid ligase II
MAGKRIGVSVTAPDRFIAASAALDLVGAHAFLLGPRSNSEVGRLRQHFQWDSVLRDEDVQPGEADSVAVLRHDSDQGRVTILTSGTTGEPKAANHTWSTLAAPARRDAEQRKARWLCAYPLTLYAGTQVLLQSLINGATLVVPVSFDPATIARLIPHAGVTHASGTPTFWRQVVFFGGGRQLGETALEQITLGGEAATQDLLDRLGGLFPRARIVHIYASTELGRLFSVTDGREGFPADYLDRESVAGVTLRIVNGELHAKSGNAMIGYDGGPTRRGVDEWTATGDLVEIRDGRVLFRGRTSDIINVGGNKVAPARVEAALLPVAGVAALRIYAKRSSLVGQLVAADVVLAPGCSADETRKALLETAREKLEPNEVPRVVRFVAQIDSTAAMKVARKESSE